MIFYRTSKSWLSLPQYIGLTIIKPLGWRGKEDLWDIEQITQDELHHRLTNSKIEWSFSKL